MADRGATRCLNTGRRRSTATIVVGSAIRQRASGADRNSVDAGVLRGRTVDESRGQTGLDPGLSRIVDGYAVAQGRAVICANARISAVLVGSAGIEHGAHSSENAVIGASAHGQLAESAGRRGKGRVDTIRESFDRTIADRGAIAGEQNQDPVATRARGARNLKSIQVKRHSLRHDNDAIGLRDADIRGKVIRSGLINDEVVTGVGGDSGRQRNRLQICARFHFVQPLHRRCRRTRWSKTALTEKRGA